ncbi:MAG: ferritin [Deltaproteobacteria bacterium]|nr:ferritin [Deltaproteobacteria bacterium]
MLNEKIEHAFNAQLNAERYSSDLYLSMAAWFYSQNLPGFANWMRVQAKEEDAHANKFFDYILARGGKVILSEIGAPPGRWDSPTAAFENVLSHERKVTGLIHDLVDLAAAEKDHSASSFLRWFVDEQVEEEESAERVLSQARMASGSPAALLMLDREFSTRTFTPPAQARRETQAQE